MSTPPPVERFKGTGWEECEEFVIAIRNRAFWEGKQRDSAWMADFAATNLGRKALLWHSRLPEDVRHDWSKLETELFDRWPPPEDEDEPQIEPTPAAAPSLRGNDRSNHPLQGALKAVLDVSNASYCIKISKTHFGHVCCATSDANEALQVRCVSLSSTTLLERISDSGRSSWLAVRWTTRSPNIGSGSTHFALMPCVDTVIPQPTKMVDWPWQITTCTLLASGEIIPAWQKDDTDSIRLVPFVGNFEYGLCLVPDPESYGHRWTTRKERNSSSSPPTKLDGLVIQWFPTGAFRSFHLSSFLAET